MKKILLLLCITFLVTNCSDDSGIKLKLDTTEIILSESNFAEITITSSVSWTINTNNSEDSWFSVYPTAGKSGTHTLYVNTTNLNTTDKEWTGYFDVISMKDGEAITKSIVVKQRPFDRSVYYNDKDIVKLFSATKGKGINLVFMGDGFTLIDLIKGKGKYETSINKAIEHFFSVEPYKSHRNYFNAYMIVAKSEESGVNSGYINVDNKFESKFGEGTHIDVNADKCIEFVELVLESENINNIGDITTTIVLNSYKYAGTCYWWSNGFSIALCPMSNSVSPYDFRGLVNHEAGGHAFAKLADEYIKIENIGKTISESEIDNLKWGHSIGFYCNVDIKNDLNTILWKDFIGHSRYSNIGAYEGGYYYSYGVWRPEDKSCMDNNIPYYNAPSRWLITKKIKHMAGEPFTFTNFLETDIIDKHGIKTLKSQIELMPPLAPPVFVK